MRATPVISYQGGTGPQGPTGPTATNPNVAGHIAADVAVGAGATVTALTTASLAIGTWLVIAKATVLSGVSGECDVTLVVGTATATIEGIFTGTNDAGPLIGGANEQEISIAAIVTVTVAGTLILQAVNHDGANAASVKKGVTSSGTGATGYSAVKIA